MHMSRIFTSLSQKVQANPKKLSCGHNPPPFPAPSLLPPSLSPDQPSEWISNFLNHSYSSSPSGVAKANAALLQHQIAAEERSFTEGKKSKTKMKKATKQRFVFHTRSDDNILDDGYRWRKYGQKSVKNCLYPRSYYRCTQQTCNVKKQVQRLTKDTSIVETTYEGIHNHPCEKLMQTLTPLLKQMQFLSRFP